MPKAVWPSLKVAQSMSCLPMSCCLESAERGIPLSNWPPCPKAPFAYGLERQRRSRSDSNGSRRVCSAWIRRRSIGDECQSHGRPKRCWADSGQPQTTSAWEMSDGKIYHSATRPASGVDRRRKRLLSRRRARLGIPTRSFCRYDKTRRCGGQSCRSESRRLRVV